MVWPFSLKASSSLELGGEGVSHPAQFDESALEADVLLQQLLILRNLPGNRIQG